MKPYLSILLLILAIASCESGNAPTIIDEKYEPSLDSLYLQCEDLKGLGPLHIGKTFREIKQDKGITKPMSELKSSFYSGHWGKSDSELDKYLGEKATSIKQLRITDILYEYKIGELEIEDLCCAFYKDTLVAISFKCTDEMLKHYITKYGNGKGSKYEYSYSRGNYGKPNYKLEHKDVEKRLWANKDVSMVYDKYLNLHCAANEKDIYYSTTSCIISSNKRYDDFLSTLEEYITQYKNEKKAKKQASFDSL